MAYTIYKSDGTQITVPDNTIDTVFYNAAGGGGFGPGNVPQSGNGLGVQLVGRNAVDYGTAIAQNFLQLTENFSSSTVPSDTTSLQGQLWFKQDSTTTGELYVRVTTNVSGGIANWNKINLLDPSGNSTITGNLTVDGSGVIGTTLAVTSTITSGGNHVPVCYNQTTAPASPTVGDIWVNSSTSQISIFGFGNWRIVFP